MKLDRIVIAMTALAGFILGGWVDSHQADRYMITPDGLRLDKRTGEVVIRDREAKPQVVLEAP